MTHPNATQVGLRAQAHHRRQPRESSVLPLADDYSTPAPRPRRFSPEFVEALAAYTAGVEAARDAYAPRAVREPKS